MNWPPLFHVFGGSFLQVDEMSGEVKIDQDGPPTVWSGLSMVEWCQLKLVAAYGKCLHISSQKTSINMGGWRYRLFHDFERVLFHFFWFQGLNVDCFLPTWTTMVIFQSRARPKSVRTWPWKPRPLSRSGTENGCSNFHGRCCVVLQVSEDLRLVVLVKMVLFSVVFIEMPIMQINYR